MAEKTGASFKRFKSRQDLGTPPEFIEAVERRFGKIAIDLAANETNHVVDRWFGPGGEVENTFDVDWSKLDGNLWLNPSFEGIQPYANKLVLECKDRAAWSYFLTPASTGANWYRTCVHNGVVGELEDRIPFVGEEKKFPKDLLLTLFGFGLVGRFRWHWDSTVVKAYEFQPKPKKPRAPRKAKAVAEEAAE